MHSRTGINRAKSKRRASRSSIASSGASSQTGADEEFDISNNAFATAILTDDTSEEGSSVLLRHELMESIMTHEVAVHDDEYPQENDGLNPPSSPPRAGGMGTGMEGGLEAGMGGEVGRGGGLDPRSAPASMPMMGGEPRGQNPAISELDDYSFRPNPAGVGSLPHHQEIMNDRLMSRGMNRGSMGMSRGDSFNSKYSRFSYSNPEVQEEVQQYQQQEQQEQQYRRQQNQQRYQQEQQHYQNQHGQHPPQQRPTIQKRASSILSIGSKTGSIISSGLSSIKVQISEIDRMIMQSQKSSHTEEGYQVPLPKMPYETRKACSIRTGIGAACLLIALIISISTSNGQIGQNTAEYFYKKFVLHGDSMPTDPIVLNDETLRNGSHLFAKVESYEQGFKPNKEGKAEDHLPSVQVDKNGSIEVVIPDHPMTKEHYIKFIWIKHVPSDKTVLARNFDPEEDGIEPILKARVPSGAKLQAYLFCNQHKLWRGEEFQVP